MPLMNNDMNTGSNTDFDLFSADGLFKGLSGLSSLLGAYSGYKGLGLAEDQFDFNKDAFGVNLANQAKLTNADLQTRQQSRNNRGVGIPLAEYMARFGVSGNIDGSTDYGQSAPTQAAPTNSSNAAAPTTGNEAAILSSFGRPTEPRQI